MQQDTTDLPETARVLIALIGYTAAMALIQAFGGRSMYFSHGKRPEGKDQHRRVAEIVGEAAAGTLARHFNFDKAYIPRCVKALRAERNRRIIEEFDIVARETSARAAVAAIAERHGLSDRRVWDIVNGYTSVRLKPE